MRYLERIAWKENTLVVCARKWWCKLTNIDIDDMISLSK